MSASEFDTGNGFSSEFRMLRRLAEASGQTVTFPLLQYDEAPERWLEIADACASARAEGIDMYGQVVGRPVGVLMGLELSRHPFMGCKTYDALAPLPLAERVAALRRPDVRAQMLKEVETVDGDGPAAFIRQFHLFYPMNEPPDYAPPPNDRLDQLAARNGQSPAEAAYDAMLRDDGRGLIYFPARNYTYQTLDVVKSMLEREDTVLGLGDGGAHVGAICDASMPTYLLSYWTRDRSGPRLEVLWVVRALTSHPAGIAGFADRGLIRPGYKADLNVIDYDRLHLHAPRVAFDLPAGGRRLAQSAEGYVATIVSGNVTFRGGMPTRHFPGKLLRSPQRLTPLGN